MKRLWKINNKEASLYWLICCTNFFIKLSAVTCCNFFANTRFYLGGNSSKNWSLFNEKSYFCYICINTCYTFIKGN